METLDSTLAIRLAEIEAAQLLRRLRPLDSPASAHILPAGQSRPSLNFSGNDYLGLAQHPLLRAAAADAAIRFGAGSTASRLICGSLAPHHDLERELAEFKRAPAALSFSSGYAAAMGTIPALVGPGDFIIADRLAHACLIDASRLSGARLRVFRHNDVGDLDRILRWVDEQRARAPHPARPKALVVTESVFSMDGDCAPLRAIVDCKRRHDAWLMVDEAHATGVLGPEGRGWIEELGLSADVEVTLGTLGKALGAAGGFIAGSALLHDFLVNRARSLIFSTAPPPAAVAAARAALGIVTSDEGARRRRDLWVRIRQLHEGLATLGWVLPPPTSPILPLIVGDESISLRLAAALAELGVFIPAIRHPTVGRGRARLRIAVGAAHSPGDIEDLVAALGSALQRTGARPG